MNVHFFEKSHHTRRLPHCIYDPPPGLRGLQQYLEFGLKVQKNEIVCVLCWGGGGQILCPSYIGGIALPILDP